MQTKLPSFGEFVQAISPEIKDQHVHYEKSLDEPLHICRNSARFSPYTPPLVVPSVGNTRTRPDGEGNSNKRKKKTNDDDNNDNLETASTRSTSNHSIENRRLYSCEYPYCNKSFTRKSSVSRHYLIHEREIRHVCRFPGCYSVFDKADQLFRHNQMTHCDPEV
eukprot:c16955_g1_i1.p1 GENE.c16955_g1_i1~~c16955_g1_i1.p1  ORF type:complete len:164 (+),score=29.68 c16955_g1_i1:104-595(+)